MGMERVMGFEPTTLCLGSRYSTPELHPLRATLYQPRSGPSNGGLVRGAGAGEDGGRARRRGVRACLDTFRERDYTLVSERSAAEGVPDSPPGGA